MDKQLKLLFRMLPVLGAICLVAGFALAIAQARFDLPALLALGVGLLLFLTLFLKAEVANLKYYLHVFVYSALVCGICVVGYLFARQYTRKIDLTAQRLYTLSDASRQALAGLKAPVTIMIFTPASEPFGAIRELYQNESDKVVWEFADALKDPVAARRMDKNVRNGDMFVVCGERKKRMGVQEILGQNNESVLTNAIIEVTRADKVKLYFLSGHGEVACERPAAGEDEKQAAPSLQAFRDFLVQRGIQTATLDLTQSAGVPEDASLVILAGPQRDLFAPEAAALQDYLSRRRGKLLVMLDVPARDFFAPMDNLTGLLEQWGIQTPNKVIIDMMSQSLGLSPLQPVLSAFAPDHPITRDLGKRATRSPLNLARPVLTGTLPPEMQAVELIKSSPDSWTEDLATVVAKVKIAPPEKSQWRAVPMGIAVGQGPPPQIPGMPMPQAKPGPSARLAVFGSSELMQDHFMAASQTAVELMLNTVNWLTEREDMIAVPPREIQGTPIMLDGAQLRVIFVLAVVLVPGALFFGGISYSLLRRRR
jgi:ABC-type uncharacterized transport system involved in gliding motility auxiliary subunit